MPLRTVVICLTVLAAGGAAFAQAPGQAVGGLHARLRPLSYQVPTGQPVYVQFGIENTTGQSVTLTVPGTEPDIPTPEVGLPVSHIFSGGNSPTAVTITTDSGRKWDAPVNYKHPAQAPILMIAPHSSVASTIDIRQYFPSLRATGNYRISWSPYGGALPSATVVVSIGSLKRVEIVTDHGTLTLRLFYGAAPKHVENFLELARSGFYKGLTFHRIEPGYFVQGGCPRGDGTGIRPDGKRIPAEFNDHPFKKGTVAMALLEDDPDSASSQFFICNTRQKDWDGRYTAFAELVDEASFATLDRLMGIEVDEAGRPAQPIVMRQVRLVDAPANETP